MPASADGLQLTNAFRAQLLTHREHAARLAASAWLALDVAELDATFARWLAQTAAVVEGVKRQGATLADAYLAAYVAAETGRRPMPQGLDPEAYVQTLDGRSVETALAPALYTVKAALGQGRSDALQLGLARASRVVAVEAMDAPRRALDDAMQAETRVTGKRRVVSANACGACLALATERVAPPSERLREHACCRCLWEATIAGTRERYRRPTGRAIYDRKTPEERAALFAGRGGAEKAALIDSGTVPFDALVTDAPMRVTPDWVTETSLAELRARAPEPARDAPAATP